jgi:hypothetical protein
VGELVPPNPRLQRTRLRSPLSRKSLASWFSGLEGRAFGEACMFSFKSLKSSEGEGAVYE